MSGYDTQVQSSFVMVSKIQIVLWLKTFLMVKKYYKPALISPTHCT